MWSRPLERSDCWRNSTGSACPGPWSPAPTTASRRPGSPPPGITPALLFTIEHVERGKPDPEGYLLAAKTLGVDPADCLVVEDSEPGLAAGRAAGAMTASLRGLDADVKLTDLGQLADLLTEGQQVPDGR